MYRDCAAREGFPFVGHVTVEKGWFMQSRDDMHKCKLFS